MRQVYSSFILIFIVCLSSSLSAQDSCATDDFLQERLENDHKFAEWYTKQIKQEKVDANTRSILSCTSSNSIIIPVAVHYNTPITCDDPACLLSQAEAQIAKMNEDFAASNADLSYYTATLNSICPSAYPLSYAPVAGEGTCIQFCLANQNHPLCSELSNGDPAITVGQYTWTSLSAPWDGYLNIYVSNTTTAGVDPGVAGISFLPGQANGDGFFVRHDVFGAPGISCSSGGTMNTLSTFDNGRVAVHEAGHYFGLPHVFTSGGCTDNDANPPGPFAINDTPEQENNSGPCPTVTSCADIPEDCPATPTSFYSYMDYSNDDCMVMFTEDQSVVVNYWATTLPFKSDATFCLGSPDAYTCIVAPTCSDLIKNQGEEGIDCGGPCPACNNTCGTSFYDPGGLCDNYGNNQLQVITVCPDNSNELLRIDFTLFDIEEKDGGGCWDWLKLYAGSTTSAPQIGGEFCGTTVADSPGSGSILAANAGDCFTFEFFSDASVIEQGWNAEIICEFVLPVELLNFTAKAEKNNIILDWETISELNNDGFNILRREGETGSFKKIAFEKGAGTSNTKQVYTYLDKTIYQNINYYYRLEQLDINGKVSNSKTVSTRLSGESLEYILHPNPADDNTLDIRFLKKAPEKYTVELYDLQGKRILRKICLESESQIDIAQIPSGVYLVKITNGSTILSVARLLRM